MLVLLVFRLYQIIFPNCFPAHRAQSRPAVGCLACLLVIFCHNVKSEEFEGCLSRIHTVAGLQMGHCTGLKPVESNHSDAGWIITSVFLSYFWLKKVSLRWRASCLRRIHEFALK